MNEPPRTSADNQNHNYTDHTTQTSNTVLSAPAVVRSEPSPRDYQPMRTTMTQDYANYQPTYIGLYHKNHRYHGFPEYNMMKGHQPVTRDSVDTALSEPKTNANIPYGENVPITQTDPRPIAGSLNERSSADHRKFRRHQLEAESDIQKYKREKMEQLQLEKEQQRRDMEMLRNYDPYGKPGGGAPLLETAKKQKFGDPPHKNYSNEAGFRFGRPGGGAPLRTNSGQIRTEITGDPLIRFHQGKTLQAQQAIKESMRYVTKREDGQQYQRQLDQQLAEKAIADQEARIHELNADFDMLSHDPYGKPGAGAPNYPHTRDMSQMYRSEPKRDEIWHPFGRSGAGAPNKDTDGNPKTIYGRQEKLPERSEREAYPLIPPESSRNGGAGAPITEEGEKRAKLPITMRRNEFGDATIKEDIPGQEPTARDSKIWYPFGKAGAGAPLVDKEGNNVTTVYGKAYHDRDSADERRKQRAAREYLNEIQTEMVEQRRNREHERDYQRAPVGELARVIQEGQVGKPRRDPYTGLLTDQHLGMSDVTRHRVNYRSQKSDDSGPYHTELSRAAEERYRNKELEKLKERQRSQQHQQAMDSFWGRPGGGAPNPGGIRYHNPTDHIHSPRRSQDAPHWEDTKDLSIAQRQVQKPKNVDSTAAQTLNMNSPRYSLQESPFKLKVRDTTHSTHKNQYEFDSPRDVRKKAYNLITPYAIA